MWYRPIVPATWVAEAGISLAPRSLGNTKTISEKEKHGLKLNNNDTYIPMAFLNSQVE